MASSPNPTPSSLPDERMSPGRVRRVVALVLLLLVGTLGVNAAANRYLRSYGTNLGYRMVSAKYDLLEDLAGGPPADWLILGDSSGAHGIVPEEWSAVAGGTTHNLAILANLLVVNDAWMLGEYLEEVGTPKNVVLVHAHDVWRRQYNSALIGQIPRMWGFWMRRAPTISLKRTHLRNVFLSRFFPLMAESSTLQTHIEHRGPERDIHFEMTADGWIPGQKHNSVRLRQDSKRTTDLLESDVFEMSDVNVRAMRVLKRYATEHGFQLYVTHAPMLDSIAKRDDYRGYVQTADYRVRRLVADVDNVHIVPDIITFPATSLEAYADHVVPEQAPNYTRQLAKAVLAYQANPPEESELRSFSAPTDVVVERESEDDTISLLFGGDTSFARGIDQTIQQEGGDPNVVMAQMQPLFDSVDFVFLNLECVLSDSEAQPANKRWRIRAPTENAVALRNAGIDMVSVSNNHTLDYGHQGFSTTLATLDDLGVAYVGVQYDDTPEQALTVARIGDQTFGFLAYTDISKWKPVSKNHWDYYWPKPANFDADAIVADIERARGSVDHLIVSVHWGDEYSMTIEDRQREAAHRFIDAGAELIVGHHPHVPRQVETYKDGVIFYSLGDFLFDKRTPYKSVRNRRRFMVQVDYKAGERSAVTLVPIHSLNNHIPYPKPDLDVSSWIAKPIETPWRAADALPTAVVTRERKGVEQSCGDWKTGSPTARNNGYLQWLRPRWACPADKERPWETVAVSGDRAAEIYKRSIWAHPHIDGVLNLHFDDVPLGQTLGGFAGVPDWPLTLASRGAPPIVLKVSVNGEWIHSVKVPYEAGWVPFTVDTSKWSGTTGTVDVAVQGGDRKETGFTFDLMVDAQP